MLEKLRKINPFFIFTSIAIINILIICISLFLSKGAFLSEVIWDARNNLFADFTSHLRRASTLRPYNIDDWDARFPALAYLFYYLVDRSIPETIINSNVSNWHLMYMCVILCLNVYGITTILEKTFKEHDKYAFIVGGIFFLSAPFALAEIKAGNSATYVLTLLLFALYLRESESAFQREIALIIIAIAAGFKVSPAIYGFLYIKEKRYPEAIRLVIYGILFFFTPFLLFGGSSALLTFLNITSQVSNACIPRPETIVGVIIEAADLLKLPLQTGLLIGKIVSFIYLITTMIIFFMTKKDWKSMFLISSLMIIFVNQSYPYTLQYILIPFIYFVLETSKNHSKGDYIHAVLYALVFTTYPLLKINWPTATFITNYFFLYIMVIMIWVEKVRLCILLYTNKSKEV